MCDQRKDWSGYDVLKLEITEFLYKSCKHTYSILRYIVTRKLLQLC